MEIQSFDVVGAREAADILGVELQRISRWRKAGKLPPPYADLALSPVWVTVDIMRVRDEADRRGSVPDLDLSKWPAPPDPPPLLGTAEVAAFMAVDKSRVARWRSNPKVDFPRPSKTIAAGPLWSRPDIERFAHGRDTVLMLTAKQVDEILGDGAVDGLEPVGKTKAGELFDPAQVAILAA